MPLGCAGGSDSLWRRGSSRGHRGRSTGGRTADVSFLSAGADCGCGIAGSCSGLRRSSRLGAAPSPANRLSPLRNSRRTRAGPWASTLCFGSFAARSRARSPRVRWHRRIRRFGLKSLERAGFPAYRVPARGPGSNSQDEQTLFKYENHYSSRLNKCLFLEIAVSHEREEGKPGSKIMRLFDLNDNQRHGTFVSGPTESMPLACVVRGKGCQSEIEWRQLVKPFMED